MKRLIVFLVFLVSIFSVAYSQTDLSSLSDKIAIEIDKVEYVKISSNSYETDTQSETKKLSDKQVEEFVNRWNSSESIGLCKYLPKYLIEVKFIDQTVRKFRVNGKNIKANNDYCFSFGDSNFIENLWLNSYKESDTYLQTGWYYIESKENAVAKQSEETNELVFLNPNPIVTVKEFKELEIYQSNSGAYGLTIKLNKTGTKNWSIATGKSIGKRLAFIFNDRLIYTPLVNTQIDFGVTALNRGDLTKDELEDIKKQIENLK